MIKKKADEVRITLIIPVDLNSRLRLWALHKQTTVPRVIRDIMDVTVPWMLLESLNPWDRAKYEKLYGGKAKAQIKKDLQNATEDCPV